MKKILLSVFLSIPFFASVGQNVGVDVPTPLEKLDVAGAIRIGQALSSNPGTIEWNGSAFRFRTTTGWVTFSANTDAQQLGLSGNALSITNGNTVSLAALNQSISLSGNTLNLSGSPSSSVNLAGYVNTDNQQVTTLSLGGSVLSVGLTNASTVTVNLDPLRRLLVDADGDTKIQVEETSDEDKIRFDAAGAERMILDNNGNLGIGTSDPVRRLHIQTSVSGVNYPVLLRNSSINAGDGAGIGFVSEPNGNWIKAGIYYERTTGYGVGKLHLLVNNASNNNSATLADARLTIDPVQGNVGIGIASPTYKLHVNGKVKTTGINETSDGRLKQSIKPLNNSLEKVLSLSGVSYEWRLDEYPNLGLSPGVEIGLIAQEVEKIIPEVVQTDSEGWMSIEYTHLVPYLIESIKQLTVILRQEQEESASLRVTLGSLESRVLDLEQRLPSSSFSANVSH